MRIIGYWLANKGSINKLGIERLTHLNIAFAIPEKSGNLKLPIDVTALAHQIKKIRKLNHLIHITLVIGGWSDGDTLLSDVFKEICSDTNKISTFFMSLSEILDEIKFDGLEIDWEYPDIESTKMFDRLMSNMTGISRRYGTTLSIAVAGCKENAQYVSDRAVGLCDWIGIMSYDGVGGYNHGSYDEAKTSLLYWTKDRNTDRDSLVVGIPLYSRPGEIHAKNFHENGFTLNDFGWKNENEFFCSDHSLKTRTHAGILLGGIMFWEISQDSTSSGIIDRVLDFIDWPIASNMCECIHRKE